MLCNLKKKVRFGISEHVQVRWRLKLAKIAREGQVFAIEKNEPDLENCFQNQRKFRADLTAIHGKAPEGLETFPEPGCYFYRWNRLAKWRN